MSVNLDNIEHSNSNESLLIEILKELKIINLHLSKVSGDVITDEDIE